MNFDVHHSYGNLTVGCLSDWTMLPLRRELQKLNGKIRLNIADKAVLRRLLETSEITMAPCSSICLLKNSKFELAMPLGVAVQGATRGAYLGFQSQQSELHEQLRERTQQLREIFIHANVERTRNIANAAQFVWRAVRNLPDPNAIRAPIVLYPTKATSTVTLTRILYRLLFGESAFENNERINGVKGSPSVGYSNFTADYCTGNEALQKRCNYNSIIDLGDIWNRLTGLPFVFYVWQRHNEILSVQSRLRVLKAAELAQASMKVEPSSYYPDIKPTNVDDQPIDLAGYWKNITYRLGSNEIRGLLFFLNLAYLSLEKSLVENDSFAVKMIRMQERVSELSSHA